MSEPVPSHSRPRIDAVRADSPLNDAAASNAAGARTGISAIRILLLILVGALSVLVIFRVPISSRMTLLTGDEFDGRIFTTILEHWFNFWRGIEGWSSVRYFYPAPNGLAYDDGLFLYGIPYSIFRAAGNDVFLATELTNIAVRFVGFFLFYWAARRVARLPFLLSMLGSVIFTLCNGLYLQSVHAQLFTDALTPLFAVLLWSAADAMRARAPARIIGFGGAAAILYGAWVMTAFYTAWFTTLFAIIMVIVALAIGACDIGRARAALRPYLDARAIWPLVVVVIILAACLAPLLILYLPKARETGMHPIASMMAFSPSVLDLVHVGSDNYAFGWLDRLLAMKFRPGYPDLDEHTVGYPPILLILALIGAVLAWVRPGPNLLASNRLFWRTLSVALVLSVLLVLHVRDHTAWVLVYRFVPAARVIRAVSRFLLFLEIPVILLALRALLPLQERPRATFTFVLAALLVVEELNGGGPIRVDRPLELQRLAAIPPIPGECHSYFVRNGTVHGDAVLSTALRANIDAMLLAEVRASYTINGDASFGPRGDNMLFVQHPAYLRRMANIAREGHVTSGLCSLDLAALQWNTRPFFQRVPLGQTVSLGAAQTPEYLGFGWSDAEEGGTWTEGDASEINLIVPADRGPLILSMAARSLITPTTPPPLVTVSANGRQVAQWRPNNEVQVFTATIPQDLIPANGSLVLHFGVDTPRVPFLLHLNSDRRALGMLVADFHIDAAP